MKFWGIWVVGEGGTYFTDNNFGVFKLRMRGLEFRHVVEQVRFQGRDCLIDVDVCALQVVVHIDEVKNAAVASVEKIRHIVEPR